MEKISNNYMNEKNRPSQGLNKEKLSGAFDEFGLAHLNSEGKPILDDEGKVKMYPNAIREGVQVDAHEELGRIPLDKSGRPVLDDKGVPVETIHTDDVYDALMDDVKKALKK